MLYIQDDRYQSKTLEVVLAPSDESASELARMCLESSPHYLAVEVWDDDRRVIRVEKEGQIPAPPRGADESTGQEQGE
ncbi:MAG TPA: hypothetical protein VG166_12070 [Caulobacteraceae bacterium]|jgi:hypothetical protein|nr:hypothetical protein [Caulobacteraceae bacterium]